MLYSLFAVLLSFVASDLPNHDRNGIFKSAVSDGIASGDSRLKLPEPTFRDGQSADEQKAAIVKLAGSTRGADEMMQASLSAPHKFRTTDLKGDRATIRSGDLYFILRGFDVDEIQPTEAFRKFRGESVDAANMRFKVQLLTSDDLKGGASPVPSDSEWLTHSTGRLLDRISVESTDRIAASRSTDSLIFATRTDPAFSREGKYPNRWSTITLKSTGDVFGPSESYVGGIGYVKLTKLQGQKNAVIVEAHFAFVEPKEWFGGEPILRSKFGLISQDQVRRMRREFLKSK